MVYFSFQDLMSFGIFIVALLTFIFQNRLNLIIKILAVRLPLHSLTYHIV